jgi:hypothetical protein
MNDSKEKQNFNIVSKKSSNTKILEERKSNGVTNKSLGKISPGSEKELKEKMEKELQKAE